MDLRAQKRGSPSFPFSAICINILNSTHFIGCLLRIGHLHFSKTLSAEPVVTPSAIRCDPKTKKNSTDATKTNYFFLNFLYSISFRTFKLFNIFVKYTSSGRFDSMFIIRHKGYTLYINLMKKPVYFTFFVYNIY